MVSIRLRSFESAAAIRTLPGQEECGDRHILLPNRRGLLIAAVDGLGHGREAALAAERAVNVIEQHGESELSMTALVMRCHTELRGTRGVVMSLAAFDSEQRMMTWLGVGNVEGRLVRRAPEITQNEETLLLRQGVVGNQLPQLQTAALPVLPGDVLVMATDGVDPEYAKHVDPGDDVQRIADEVIEHHGRRYDDALVLVVRYLG